MLSEINLLAPKVKVTQNVAQFPLHHVSYAPAKFAVATSNGLGGDAFSRNNCCTYVHTFALTDGRWTHCGTKLIYPFF